MVDNGTLFVRQLERAADDAPVYSGEIESPTASSNLTRNIRDIVDRLLRNDTTAISLYRPGFATPEDIPSMRFWVQGELDSIQNGFSSTDEVVKLIAKVLGALLREIDE